MKKHSKIPPKPSPFPKIAAVQKEKHPEPMTLFRKREQAGMVPDVVQPKPEITIGMAEKAAGVMADWDNSDPFSYGRTMLHVRQGYLDPREIVKNMSKKTLERRLARIEEVETWKL